jgi:hypothetical protein
MKLYKKLNSVLILTLISSLLVSCDFNLNQNENITSDISYTEISSVENIQYDFNIPIDDDVYVYRDLLTDDEKKLYDKIYTEISKMKTTIKVKGYDYDGFSKVFDCVVWDHPELFWITGSFEGSTLSLLAYKSIELKLGSRLDESLIAQYKQEFDSKVNSIAQLAMQYDTDYEKALFVHDYLVANSDYDVEAAQNADVNNMAYCAYSCIMGEETVCMGYSMAFQIIMQKIGIPCGTVHGSAIKNGESGESHMWNFVNIDGNYYYVDLTWDDPVQENSENPDFISHCYFMITTDDILKDHTISDHVSEYEDIGGTIKYNYIVPECNSIDYNYYNVEGGYFDDFDLDSIGSYITANLDAGAVEIKFADSDLLDLAVQRLCYDLEIYSFVGTNNGLVSYTKKDTQNILVIYF